MRPETAAPSLSVAPSGDALVGGGTLADVAEDLLGFSGLSGEELDTVYSECPLVASTSTVDLANVSVIYRVASVARASRLKVGELLALANALGVGASAFNGNFADLISLLDLADEVSKAPLSVEEVLYVTTSSGGASGESTDAALTAALTELITTLQVVASEERAKSAPADLTAAARAEVTLRRLGKTDSQLETAATLIAGTFDYANLDESAAIDDVFSFEGTVLVSAASKTILETPVDPPNSDRTPGDTEAAIEDFVTQAEPVLLQLVLVNATVRWFAAETGVLSEDALVILENTQEGGEDAITHFTDEANFWSTSVYDPDVDGENVGSEDFVGTFLLVPTVASRAKLLRRLLKASFVVSAYGLRKEILRWHYQSHSVPEIAALHLDLRTLPVEGEAAIDIGRWRWLNGVVALHPRFLKAIELYGIFDAITSGGSSSAALISALAEGTELDPGVVSGILDDSGLLSPATALLPRGPLRDFFSAVDALSRLSAQAAEARRWGQGLEDESGSTVEATSATASSILAAAKSRNPPDVWPSVLEPAENRLRSQRRDVLVDWLLANKPEWNDTDDILADRLVDVLVSPCGSSSRTLQAISMTQLFIFRVLMGIQDDFELSQNESDDWVWLGRYRLWEANRKIFLYPENFLAPELRQDKTPLFEEFQERLTQSEVDESSIEDAYLAYLRGLSEIARPEVIGTFTQVRKGPESTVAEQVVHVLARSRKPGGKVYYRKQINHAYWTAWNEVPFDVGAPDVTMFVTRGRVVAVWTDVQERAEIETETERPDPRIEIGLMSAELRNGEWTGPFASKNKLTTPATSLLVDPKGPQAIGERRFSRLLVNVDDRNGSPKVIVGFPSILNGELKVDTAGYFEYRACDENFVAAPNPIKSDDLAGAFAQGRLIKWVDLSAPPRLDVSYGAFEPYGDYDRLQIRVDHPVLGKPVHSQPILKKNGFSVVGERNNGVPLARNPFFFQDAERTFLLFPREDASALGKDPKMEAISENKHAGFADESLPGKEDPKDKSQELHFFPLEFRLVLFYHPFVCDMTEQVARLGAMGLVRPPQDDEASNKDLACQKLKRNVFSTNYSPGPAIVKPLPEETFAFEVSDPYSIYNWELFVYIPLFVADRYMAQGRYAEARQWLHALFDPTRSDRTESRGFGCTNYWWAKPLKEAHSQESVQGMLDALTADGSDDDSAAAREEVESQISLWRERPFDPHAIGRIRPQAFQKAVVVKYIEMLVAWGDSLFRQDTIEANNEATQLYFLAKQLLGRKPSLVDAGERSTSKRFSQIKDEITLFGDPVLSFEDETTEVRPEPRVQTKGTEADDGYVPAGVGQMPFSQPHVDDGSGGKEPYFCVPANDAMLGLWDTVDDRLFKLRNCLNIEGVFRQLPLFQPPIDPALIAAALAQGVDLGSAISGLSAPLPHYRFSQMLASAKEITSTVQSLGSELLSALEKRDAEEVSVLRAKFEQRISDDTIKLREKQRDAATEGLAAAKASRRSAEIRLDYYNSRERMNDLEIASDTALTVGTVASTVAEVLMLVGGGIESSVPQFKIGGAGLASPIFITEYGGKQISAGPSTAAAALNIVSSLSQFTATMLDKQANYTRRKEDWDFQADLAGADLEQIDKQILEAEIRLAVAEQELELARKQASQSAEIAELLQEKFTNRELYNWMVGRLSSLYFGAYNLAVDVARRAQRCFQFELAEPTASFVKFGHWDNRRQGLLAGQRLMSELMKMESAYQERNRREYELTKRVSLRDIAPEELVRLRSSGRCNFSLTEALFNREHPSHIMRRIKSVAVTVPSVTGPFDSIGGTLTYLRGSLRVEPSTAQAALVGDTYGSAESISISTGQDDTGLFETQLQDPRYLPFEGKGLVDSNWTLTLPGTYRPFDYNTISDVILTVRYTAREGGLGTFGQDNQDALKAAAGGGTLVHFVSLRSVFPEAFNALTVPGAPATADITLDENVFPRVPFEGTVVPSSATVFVVAGVPFGTSSISGEFNFYPAGQTPPPPGVSFNPFPNDTDADDRTRFADKGAVPEQLGDWTLSIGGVPDLGAPYKDIILALTYKVS